jgi:putative addiction module component (TIGR02574 family)
MTQAAEEILQKALELPEADRERIADALWRSAHGWTVESIAEEWKIEIQRRIAEIDSGKVELIPGEEVMASLRSRFAK